MKVKVEVEKKIRIDKYLSSELDLSRSKIQKLIKDELVLVNDKIVSSNYQVKDKDEIVLPGLGVLFEILWNNSNDNQKNEILQNIYEGIKKYD